MCYTLKYRGRSAASVLERFMTTSPSFRCASAAFAVFVALTLSSCADDEARPGTKSIVQSQNTAPAATPTHEKLTFSDEPAPAAEPAPDPGDSAAATVDPAATDDEVERTYAMSDELSQMVETLSAQLPANQASAFRDEQAGWRSHGFRCPNGPGYHACAQYHIKARIRELRHRVEPVTSTAIAPMNPMN